MSYPSGVWGGAPVEIEFGAFLPLNLTSGGNYFDDFPQNQITEFSGKFPNFFHAEFGNVKVISQKLCNYVCVLLHFDKKDHID